MNSHIKTAFAYVLLILTFLSSSGYAQTSRANSDADTAKIKSRVKKFADENKKVKVTTSFDEEAQGRITKYTDSDFTLMDSKTGTEKVFEYNNIWRIDRKRAMSPGSIIAIAAAGAAAAIIAGVLLKRCANEGGC